MGFKFKIYDQSKAYFVTFTVVEWVDVFSRKIYKDIVIDSLKHCQQKKGLNIFAYVIMTNHIHMIVNSEKEDLSGVIRDMKQFTSNKIIETIQTEPESRREWMLSIFSNAATKHTRNTNYQFWQHESHPLEVFSNNYIKQKVNYIHNNPVKAGIVEKPEDYIYSSARNYADLESVIDIIKLDLCG